MTDTSSFATGPENKLGSIVSSRPEFQLVLNATAVPGTPFGAGYYVVELVKALEQIPSVALSIVARRDDHERWSAISASARVRACAPQSLLARLAYEELCVGPIAKKEVRRSSIIGESDPIRPGVFHGPHYSLPLGLGKAHSLRANQEPGRGGGSRLAAVATVHDMTFLDHPQWHERSKVRYFSAMMARSARRADCIVCPSKTTADRFSEHFTPSCPVMVAPHGVDHERFSPKQTTAARDEDLLKGFGLFRPYLLHLGTLEPRKDVASLVQAFDRIASLRGDLDLVLAGKDGWGMESLENAIAHARHKGRIRRLGYVKDEEVPALLRNASCVAYPSLEEGFGLPALEALACGAPLVTSAGSVMAELAGAAALIVPASDSESLAAALEEQLAGGPLVEERRRKGLEVAERYTWDKSARLHLEAYRLALGLGRAKSDAGEPV